jgi:hypothetical protein
MFVVSDKLRFECLACCAHPYLNRSGSDRVAAMGVRFTNAYVQSPITMSHEDIPDKRGAAFCPYCSTAEVPGELPVKYRDPAHDEATSLDRDTASSRQKTLEFGQFSGRKF